MWDIKLSLLTSVFRWMIYPEGMRKTTLLKHWKSGVHGWYVTVTITFAAFVKVQHSMNTKSQPQLLI